MILLLFKGTGRQNLNNSWAILDAISEEINNNIFRKATGFLTSSAIIDLEWLLDMTILNPNGNSYGSRWFDKEMN
jgi:hypothetical protein